MNSDSIRQAAILVSALDMDAADALLEQMPPEFASQVRQCVMELDDIDASEEQLVIDRFLRREAEVSEPQSPLDVIGTTMSLEDYLDTTAMAASHGDEAGDKSDGTSTGNSVAQPPLQFLHEAEPEQVFHAIRLEPVQVRALVLSHLPPHPAAAVLAMMPATEQVEIARRMSELGEVHPERRTLRVCRPA